MINLFSHLIAELGPDATLFLIVGAFLFLLLICISPTIEERFCRFLYDIVYILRKQRLPRRRLRRKYDR